MSAVNHLKTNIKSASDLINLPVTVEELQKVCTTPSILCLSNSASYKSILNQSFLNHCYQCTMVLNTCRKYVGGKWYCCTGSHCIMSGCAQFVQYDSPMWFFVRLYGVFVLYCLVFWVGVACSCCLHCCIILQVSKCNLPWDLMWSVVVIIIY